MITNYNFVEQKVKHQLKKNLLNDRTMKNGCSSLFMFLLTMTIGKKIVEFGWWRSLGTKKKTNTKKKEKKKTNTKKKEKKKKTKAKNKRKN